MVERPALEDVRIATRACPRCGSELVAVAIGRGATAHACGDCHGSFLPPLAWSAIFEASDVTSTLEAHLPSRAAPPATRLALVRCSVCQQEMERTRFAATSDIVIDTCRFQHGVWLDAGEIDGIVRYAEHRERIGHEAAAREADAAWARAHASRPVAAAIELEEARIRAESAARVRRGAQLAAIVGVSVLLVFWLAAAPSCSTSARPQASGRQPERQENDPSRRSDPTHSSSPGFH
jgi:Zn-finger nucleic acid-binding protein